MVLDDLADFLSKIHPEMPRLFAIAVVLLTAGVVYRILSRSLSRVSRRLELDAHLQNSLRLVLRVVTLLALTTALFSIYELPTTWFLGSSALIGAAIGFGSSQTINNIAAGLYVILSRPFRVKDYVKIGDVEGQVEEISVNYTKLYVPSFNLLQIPNIQVLNSRILNCTHEGFIKYTFTLGLPHAPQLSNEDIMRKCVEPAIDEFNRKHQSQGFRKPEAYFETSTNLGRTFKIRVFIPKGEAKTLFMLQPELADMILNRWDARRKT